MNVRTMSEGMKAGELYEKYPEIWSYIFNNKDVSVFRVVAINTQTEYERLAVPGMMSIPLEAANLLSSIPILYKRKIIISMETHHYINNKYLAVCCDRMFSRVNN